MALSAGKLRHKVTIQKQQSVQDPDTGVIVTQWADVASVWASVEPLSAREFVEAAKIQSSATTRVTIRYRAGITPSMRVLHLGHIYGIQGVLADKDSGLEYLTLPCSDGPSEGL